MLLWLVLWMPVAAGPADEPQRMIDGVAQFAGTGRPAAGLTLQIIEQGDPKYTVVVDAAGRFRSPSPPRWSAPQPDGVEPPCRAVAEPEGRWQIEPINSPSFHFPQERLRETVAVGLSRYAKAIWRKGVLVVECPEPGEVDVLVRGTDGEPLADRPVEVVPDQAVFRSAGPANARFTGRTDASGHFRMRWFEGPRQLRVKAPGEGTCSTPTFHVEPGKTVAVETLPMARFGSISGRLAPGLAGPGVSVVLEPEVRRPTPCDAEGRFEIRDLLPGRYRLRLTNGKQSVRAAQVTVWLAPAGKVEGLVFDEVPPPTPEEAEQREKILEQLNGRRGPDDKDELWVEGTVRDATGRPLAEADVFVRSAFHGGLRMYEDVRQAVTDEQGHYAISGPIHGFVEGLVVIAKAKGRPPAVAHAKARSARHDRPAKLDLTLADAGGSASVAVIKDGKPRAGAKVRLEAENGANIHFGLGWARDASGSARAALDAVLAPTAETGQDGVAHFAELLPGLYTARSEGVAHGLAVSPDREAKATLLPAPIRHDMQFQVVRPDGRPVAGQDVSLQFGLRGVANLGSSLKLDENGAGSRSFESAGLWTVVVRFRDEPVNSFPIHDRPYYEAEAQVPISPALGAVGPIRLIGVRHEPRAGSLLVRLLDADGRPARGVAEFSGAIGSTDERGEIRFEGLATPPPGSRPFVSGYSEGPAPPPWSTAGPMPADDALRERFMLVPGVEATVVPGREETLELRARPLGYIRGKLKPPEGRTPRDYAVSPWYDPRVLEPNWRYEPATGDFLAGPFPGGPATLQLSMWMPDGNLQNCGRQVVEVVPGEVAQVELRPGEPEAADRRSARLQVMLGMGGLSVNPGAPEATPPTVFLPDGVTPAFAAQAVLFVPDQEQPAAHGISDASGRLTWRGMWSYGNQGDRPEAGLVEEPTLVVSLPGRHGAAIIPPEERPGRPVVLPPPIEAEGTVTVGGRRPSDDGSLIRVVAAHQGRGVLDAALGLSTTAGPDGRFTFAGLTPGRYRVQAARDGIWTSKAVEVVVEPGKATTSISLDIPPPGEPVTLEFVDPAGRPIAGESFTLARPEGPFAALWPATLRTDDSGRLTLRALEVGSHSVSLAGTTEAQTFRVGEAPAQAAQAVVKRIVLQRPGRAMP